MKRRQFLKRTAGVAVAAVAAPYVVPAAAMGAGGAVAPSDRVTMGIIGLHNQGTNVHMQTLMDMPETRILALCDVDMRLAHDRQRKLNAAYGNKDCKVYQDFHELIARDDIDAVLIATPDHWHALISIAAANAGKHVFCEKPLAHSIPEGRAIVEAVRRNGVAFQTGSQQRSEQNFRLGCELARNGYLGKVSRAEASIMTFPNEHQRPVTPSKPMSRSLDYDLWLGPAPYEPYHHERTYVNWRWNYNHGGGQIMDWIGHNWDICQWGMGLDATGPVEVEPVFVKWVKPGLYHTISTFEFRARFADGRQVKVASQGMRGQSTLIGDKGWVTMNRGHSGASDRRLLNVKIKPDQVHLHKSPGNSHHMDFFNAIRTGAETAAPAEAGHRSASMGWLGVAALKLGRKLKWDPAAEQVIGDDEAKDMLQPVMREPWTL